MSVELLTKFLTILFGYAMPALECFKAVEQRTGRTDQLRFWCQYWIILVLMVIFDEIAGALVSKIQIQFPQRHAGRIRTPTSREGRKRDAPTGVHGPLLGWTCRRRWASRISCLSSVLDLALIACVRHGVVTIPPPGVPACPQAGACGNALTTTKTFSQGTDIVYETFVRPLVMQYEPNIEERLRYLRANAGDLIVFYLKNFTDRGYEIFLRVLDYVRSQATSGSKTRRFFSFRGDRAERPSFVDDDYVPSGDRRSAARQRRPRGGDY